MKELCATVLCVCKFVYVKVCVCVKELFGVTKLCAKDCVCVTEMYVTKLCVKELCMKESCV